MVFAFGSHRLSSILHPLSSFAEVRQCGFIAGIEVFKDVTAKTPYDWKEKAGVRVCQEMRKRGVLTRPIGNTIVLMPPYCVTTEQLDRIVNVLAESIVTALSR